MLMPRLWNDSFFDNWMEDFPTTRHFPTADAAFMKTDVKENESGYEVEMDLPGCKKEDVNAELANGYLTVTATTSHVNEEKEENYIRKERYSGSTSRRFYVGENVKEEDISAKFVNGVLVMNIPKVTQPKIEEKKYIAIEGE